MIGWGHPPPPLGFKEPSMQRKFPLSQTKQKVPGLVPRDWLNIMSNRLNLQNPIKLALFTINLFISVISIKIAFKLTLVKIDHLLPLRIHLLCLVQVSIVHLLSNINNGLWLIGFTHYVDHILIDFLSTCVFPLQFPM